MKQTPNRPCSSVSSPEPCSIEQRQGLKTINPCNLGELSEMYEIELKKPEKKHANSSGEVLWYGPANGFWVGHWSLPTYCYTHWMMLPDPPQRTETPAERAEREFNAYFEATFSKRADDKQSEGDAALREKMREAFMRGAQI